MMIDLSLPRTRVPCAMGLWTFIVKSLLSSFVQANSNPGGLGASIPCAAIKLASNDLWLNCLAFGRKNTNLHCDLILSENFDGGYYYIFFTSHKKTWQACTPPIGQI